MVELADTGDLKSPARKGVTVRSRIAADGVYQVSTRYLCAAFVVKNGKVTMCAPILKRNLAYYITIAKRIGD